MGTIIFGKNVELEYITDGAEMECTFGSMPCNLKTLPKKIVIGGKTGCTIKDNDPIANGFNFGVCSLTQKPCSSLIKLLEWQNAKEDLKIEGASALTEESTIFCTQGGKITFKHSGQFQENKVTTGAEKAKSEYGKASEEKAKLQVTKVAFETSYDICSDDYGLLYEEKNEEGNVIYTKSQYDSDYIKNYILEDGGEYYHWLNKRSNPLDDRKYKPDPIPITFASSESITLKAILRVVSDKKCATTPQVRVTHKTRDKKKYEFKTSNIKQLDDENYEITISSTNLPFEETIRYLEIFELLFEYSEDGKVWISAGTSRNTLYITWKKPLYEKFLRDGDGILLNDMQIIGTKTKKELILETLLWLGCKSGKGKNEKKIVENIFEPFEKKKVFRARENDSKYLSRRFPDDGLGYWRGKSALENGDKNYDTFRSVRYLLREGEARCQEFTDFFLHLLLTQGIDIDFKNDICYIMMKVYSTNIRNNVLSSPVSYEFSVKDAKFILGDINHNEYIVDGISEGQGNKEAQSTFSDHIWVYFRRKAFFDPSYGKKYSEFDSTLRNYINKNLNNLFLRLDDKKNYRYPMIFSPPKKFNGYIISIKEIIDYSTYFISNCL